MDWSAIAARSLEGIAPTREESLAVLRATDEETPAIVAAAHALRRRYFGNTVKVNFLVNIKSGICPEDCHYCSQSKPLAERRSTSTTCSPAARSSRRPCVATSSAPAASAWWHPAAVRATPTSRTSPTPSARCTRRCRTPRSAPVSGCWRPGRRRQLQEARRLRLQPQPQHQRGLLRRDLQHTRLRGPRRAPSALSGTRVSRRAAARSSAWARPTTTSSTWRRRCARSASTPCPSTSSSRSRARRSPGAGR